MPEHYLRRHHRTLAGIEVSAAALLAALFLAGQTLGVMVIGQSTAFGMDTTAASTTQSKGNTKVSGRYTANTGRLQEKWGQYPFSSYLVDSPGSTAWPWVDLTETTTEGPAWHIADKFYDATGRSPWIGESAVSGTPYNPWHKKPDGYIWRDTTQAIEAFGSRQRSERIVAVALFHGEADYSNAAYCTSLVEWQANLQTKIQASTESPVGTTIPLVQAQVGSTPLYCGGISTATTVYCAGFKAQYDCARANPTTLPISGPAYQFTYVAAGNPHINAAGNQLRGAKMGAAIASIYTTGVWQPLWPRLTSPVARSGQKVKITFNVPTPPLVLNCSSDQVNITDPGNYGFTMYDQAGAVTVTGVQLCTGAATPDAYCDSADQVIVTYSGTLTGQAVVQYAWICGYLVGAGPVTGARGCLRDSSLDVVGATPNYNWGTPFQENVP